MSTVTSHKNATREAASLFDTFAGLCAILTGIVGLLYALSFFVLRNAVFQALFLQLGGLFTLAVLVGLYQRLRQTEAAYALLALLTGIAGALGTLIHGGYDLANALYPSALSIAQAQLPNAIDPRGLLAFGMAGVSVFFFAWLVGRSRLFPAGLSYIGYVAAFLLVFLYVARLIILFPTNPLIAVPALLSGFLINPVWYIWLGIILWRGENKK